MKTTPKPRATKKSKGELVGLLLASAAGLEVAGGGPGDVDDGADMTLSFTSDKLEMVQANQV